MADDAKQGGGIAYRLGWVLYWVCLALALASGLFFVVCYLFLYFRVGVLINGLYSLALYALGRAFRYVLSGE